MTYNALILFGSSYIMVFFLGMQHLFVSGGNKPLVFINSILVGVAQITLYKFAPSATGYEIVAYLFGGPFGVISAMYFFAWIKRKWPNLFSHTET